MGPTETKDESRKYSKHLIKLDLMLKIVWEGTRQSRVGSVSNFIFLASAYRPVLAHSRTQLPSNSIMVSVLIIAELARGTDGV